MKPKVGVITFPGSNDDRDALRAVALMGGEPVPIWHQDSDLRGADAVILPGGFSYGDYLRTGAIARFAPAMAGRPPKNIRFWASISGMPRAPFIRLSACSTC